MIKLSKYLTYVELGSEVSLEQFRDLIVGVYETEDGKAVKAKDVTITGMVDSSRLGSYDVKFTYINQENLSYSVILTVVVQ